MKKKISIKGYVSNLNYSTATFLFRYKGTTFNINYGCNTPYLNDRFPCHREFQNKHSMKNIFSYRLRGAYKSNIKKVKNVRIYGIIKKLFT